MTTIERTIEEVIQKHNIRMDVEHIDERPDRKVSEMPPEDQRWNADANHFRCTLRKYKNRRMVVYFSQGSAISGEPTPATVLDCLASDAAGYENSRSFEDWCGEYGYDTDSRKAERTYKEVKTQTEKLRRFLGDNLFDEVLWHTERL